MRLARASDLATGRVVYYRPSRDLYDGAWYPARYQEQTAEGHHVIAVRGAEYWLQRGEGVPPMAARLKRAVPIDLLWVDDSDQLAAQVLALRDRVDDLEADLAQARQWQAELGRLGGA